MLTLISNQLEVNSIRNYFTDLKVNTMMKKIITLLLFCIAVTSHAEIRIIVPFSAGGSFDVIARRLAPFIEAEFGDVLFSLINYARFLKINPESALERTNQKFIQRFQFIEAKAKAQSSSIEKLSLDEMEILWQQAKN